MSFQRRNVLQIGSFVNLSGFTRCWSEIEPQKLPTRQCHNKDLEIRGRGGPQFGLKVSGAGGGGGASPPWIRHCSISFSYIIPSKTNKCTFWTSRFFTFTLPHLTKRRIAYIKPRCQTRIPQRSYKTWRWQFKFHTPPRQMIKFPTPLAQVMVKYPGFPGGGGDGEVANSSAHNGFQVIVCRALWVSLLWWVLVGSGSGRAGGRGGGGRATHNARGAKKVWILSCFGLRSDIDCWNNQGMILIWNWVWVLDNVKYYALLFSCTHWLGFSQVLTLIQEVWEKLGYHAHASV